MSLLWPERLALAIYPGRIAWLRAAGWRQHVLQKGELHFAEHDLSALATAFSSVLEQSGKRGRVDVLLSNRLVRYALVPNPDNARNLAERKRLASHAFERIHGKEAEGWRIALSHARPGKTALAGAVDIELLDVMHEAASARRYRIANLRPYLMAAFNSRSHRLSGGSGMFAVAEPGRVCVAAWHEGGWAGVQQSHLAPHAAGLPGVLARVGAMAGLTGSESVRMYSAECSGIAQDVRISGVPVRWPAGLSPTEDVAWGGAVLGLA